MNTTAAPVQRCRATALTSSISVFNSQCHLPAKGERLMGGEMLPSCGRHLQIKFSVDAYRQQFPKYESPTVEEIASR